jgi:8-oxo-dGTP pyrophosphatase MutT (NUDIX family)
MTNLADIDGEDFTASDDEIQAAVEEAAEELGMDPDTVSEEVAYILDSGSGRVNNEGVAGAAVGSNADTADDPRLEALEVFKLRQEL